MRKLSIPILFLLGAFLLSFEVLAQPSQPTPVESVRPADDAVVNSILELRRELLEQRAEIKRLREIVDRQADQLAKLNQIDTVVKADPNAVRSVPADIEQRLANVEKRSAKTSEMIERNQLGSLAFSGDMRIQYDSLYGLLNSSQNVGNPNILGNELSNRHRIRYRLRFAVKGGIGGDVQSGYLDSTGKRRTDREFEWGIRLTAGTLANPASPNPVLTDFFSRKPLGIDQVYVSWRPQFIPGLRIVAGKFETPWNHTEMTFDNDVQVEGVGQTYSRDFKNKIFKNLTVSAWQLPMLERGTTFVRNADGTVNLGESRRNGRDLGLFGAQVQGKFALSSRTSLTLSIADLGYANTDSINPVQVFGANLSLPVTITIPANGNVPAQTVNTVVNIPREFLVAGNGNLGLSAGTNNAVNRNGRLASGFNLVDVMAQAEFRQYRHVPLTLIFNYVRNTAARDVIVSGPGGADLALENDENTGLWAEIRIQSLRKDRSAVFNAPARGDFLFSVTYLRIKKDAVLTPFNWDDLIQGSDVEATRIFFSYYLDPRVTFNVTGLFNGRPNGLSGPFASEPAGSLGRPTTRLQFDTVFRF